MGLRERATRMTLEALADPARARGGVAGRIAVELGIGPEALRTWVRPGSRSTRAPALGSRRTRPSGSREPEGARDHRAAAGRRDPGRVGLSVAAEPGRPLRWICRLR